jgi:serine/threonine protein kinase
MSIASRRLRYWLCDWRSRSPPLEEAHNKRLFHRDLKSRNILVTPAATAKFLDFSIARLMASREETRSVAISGMPLCMSPEQVEGQPPVSASLTVVRSVDPFNRDGLT